MLILNKTIRYPAVARENGTQGRVIMQFVCEKDGSLTDIQVARGIGDGCDEEATRKGIESFAEMDAPVFKMDARYVWPIALPISFTLAE